MIYGSLAIGLVFFVLFVIKCHNQRSVGGVFLKNMTSIFFIITAVIALVQNPSQYQYGVMILAGLVFGMLGDIYLDQKWVYPADDRKYLYAGFVSFAIGHLFYIPAIIITSGIPLKLLWIPALFAAIVVVFVLVTEKPMKQNYGEFRLTVALYGVVVAGMAGTSMLAAVVTRPGALSDVFRPERKEQSDELLHQPSDLLHRTVLAGVFHFAAAGCRHRDRIIYQHTKNRGAKPLLFCLNFMLQTAL